jgi:hypothetical protein
MTIETGVDDGLRLDTVDFFTRAWIRENDAVEYRHAPFYACMHRLDGGIVECGFPDIASIAVFIREMNARSVEYFVGMDEKADAIRALVEEVGAASVH